MADLADDPHVFTWSGPKVALDLGHGELGGPNHSTLEGLRSNLPSSPEGIAFAKQTPYPEWIGDGFARIRFPTPSSYNPFHADNTT